MTRLQHLPKPSFPGLSALWPGSQQSVTVLSVDGQSLRLVHSRGHRSRRIAATIVLPVQGLGYDEVRGRLREACRKAGCQPQRVLIANPAHLTTTRLFTLPSADPKEIRDIVDLQAEKHTPYAKDEILTDFKMLETDASGYSRVMLIISHQDVVRRAVRIIEGMGWSLERVGFELEGLVSWFGMTRSATPPTAAILLAELHEETTTLLMLHRHKPYFHRSLTIGSRVLREQPDAAARFAGELRRSLEALEGEGFRVPVTEIVLTGHAVRLPALAPEIKRQMNIEVTVVASSDGWQLSPQAQATEAAAPVAFTSLYGLAAAGSEVDLTPPAMKLHRTFEARAQALVGLGCQVLLGLILAGALLLGRAHRQEQYYRLLADEYDRSLPEAQRLEQTLNQLELVGGWTRNRGRLLDALAELNRLCPSAIRWDMLTYTKSDQMLIKGVSEELPKVFEYVAALERSPLFGKVEARRVTKRKQGSGFVTEFEISCPFRDADGAGEPG